jgi:hypothetical protein
VPATHGVNMPPVQPPLTKHYRDVLKHHDVDTGGAHFRPGPKLQTPPRIKKAVAASNRLGRSADTLFPVEVDLPI